MGFAAAKDVVPLLKQFGYEAAFKKAFPKDDIPLSPANYALAIQAYEETLVTPSAFDLYLNGDGDALSGVQKRDSSRLSELGVPNVTTVRS
jgi:cytochrome c peroxidase